MNTFDELEKQLCDLVELEKALDSCEEEQESDAFMMIRLGLSMLLTSFVEFKRLLKKKRSLNKDEAVLLLETIRESKSFVRMHVSAFV
jgi:hypothetical protein